MLNGFQHLCGIHDWDRPPKVYGSLKIQHGQFLMFISMFTSMFIYDYLCLSPFLAHTYGQDEPWSTKRRISAPSLSAGLCRDLEEQLLGV